MNKNLKKGFSTFFLGFFLCCGWGSASAEGAHDSNDEMSLAKASQNPIADLVSLPIEDDINPDVGAFNRTQNELSFKPVDPFPIGGGWNLVLRTIVPFYLPQPFPIEISGQVNGIGDINPSLFLVPPAMGEFMIGLGPTLLAPTASHTITGTGKWCTGPTGVIVWTHKAIVAGVLVTQKWSFAGEQYRSKVSQLTLQPFFNYNLKKGWFLFTNPILSENWDASPHNHWTVPVGGGAGRVFKIGPQHCKLSVAVYDNVLRPHNTNHYSIQTTLTLLFPKT